MTVNLHTRDCIQEGIKGDNMTKWSDNPSAGSTTRTLRLLSKQEAKVPGAGIVLFVICVVIFFLR